MYLVINSECTNIPEEVKPLVSQGAALLNLLYCLDYDPCDPPLADLLKRQHHLDGDWLILSPIHWQASHNDAMIVATGKELKLQDTDAKAWFATFSDYLAAEGMTLYYHDAETWLLCDPKQHPLNAKPAQQLIDKSLMPELAQLDQSLFWQKFVTESQMLCASKPNESLINGLWPWGNSKLSDAKALTICADETFLDYAKICSTQVTLYNPSVALKDYQILLISELSTLSESHQNELKKIQTHWYWNNSAYTSGNSNWFTRLWRK